MGVRGGKYPSKPPMMKSRESYGTAQWYPRPLGGIPYTRRRSHCIVTTGTISMRPSRQEVQLQTYRDSTATLHASTRHRRGLPPQTGNSR